jgi:hypothetical protein
MDGDLNSGEKRQLRAGRGWKRFLHVSAITPGFYVADFRISFPVEKGWLAAQHRVEGFGSEQLRHRVGERLAFLGGRPAFAGSFVRAVQGPLTRALRDLKRSNSALFDSMDDAIPELGVRLDNRLNPLTAQVVILFATQLTYGQREWWLGWCDACRYQAAADGITLQALDFRALGAMSALEYRQLTILPLANLSSD